jgi:hypothetical protein
MVTGGFAAAGRSDRQSGCDRHSPFRLVMKGQAFGRGCSAMEAPSEIG